MSWDYEKLRKKSEENAWASYSDLFILLSVVFLMMYVVTGIRSKSESLVRQIASRELMTELNDLREQTKVYSTLKDNYLKNSASEEEQKTYAQLMKQLSLLQDDARNEKKRLQALAQENEQKEVALNQYQQIIRNIINANILNKAGLKRRDEKIEQKNQELAQASMELQSTSRQLQETSVALNEREKLLSEKGREIQLMQRDIEVKKKMIEANNAAIESANSEFEKKMAELKQQEKNAQQLKNKIAELKMQSDKKISDLQAESARVAGELKNNTGKVVELEKALQIAKKNTEQYKEFVEALQNEKEIIKNDLARSKQTIEAKKKLATDIQKALSKAGLQSDVNPKSGDVLLTFGNEYFDTNQSRLKPGMKTFLDKFFPAYAKAIFNDPTVSKKIDYIEIIGYSSPTFAGKYVDPQSLTEQDRVAVNYNLDLSYQRARSIFKHITNTKKISFPNQKTLLPLIKVTGRSYLAESIVGRDIKNGISSDDFCKKYDCRRHQRVVIKFDLKE